MLARTPPGHRLALVGVADVPDRSLVRGDEPAVPECRRPRPADQSRATTSARAVRVRGAAHSDSRLRWARCAHVDRVGLRDRAHRPTPTRRALAPCCRRRWRDRWRPSGMGSSRETLVLDTPGRRRWTFARGRERHRVLHRQVLAADRPERPLMPRWAHGSADDRGCGRRVRRVRARVFGCPCRLSMAPA